MRLDGQTVLVTGASRGLGCAIALAVAEVGANVVLAARDTTALDAVAAIITQLGSGCLAVHCDVREPKSVSDLIDRAYRRFEQIDTVVNGAGLGVRAPLATLTPESWDDLFATQVRGTMLVTRAVLPQMQARKRGNIINLVAPLNQLTRPGLVAYAAATHAVIGFTTALAREVQHDGINVNGLQPGGWVATTLGRTLADDNFLLDPAILTPAAIALAIQPPHALSGTIVDAIAWNTDDGLGAGLG